MLPAYEVRRASEQVVRDKQQADGTLVPTLPLELIFRIVEYSTLHDEAITIRPEHSHEKSYRDRLSQDFDNRNSAITNQRLYMTYTAPPINLLLVNREIHDECIKQFYSQNLFNIVDKHSVPELAQTRKVSPTVDAAKRIHIRKVTRESHWVLGIRFMKVNQEKMCWFQSSMAQGDTVFEHVGPTEAEAGSYFPNLDTIELRVRCRYVEDWRLSKQRKPRLSITWPHQSLHVEDGDDVLENNIPREIMERQIADAVKNEWEDLELQSYLPMINLRFLYSMTDEWDENVPAVPVLSLPSADE